jgi:hypothetical protein
MTPANSGSAEMLYGARHNDDRLRHFIYYIDRHIEHAGSGNTS